MGGMICCRLVVLLERVCRAGACWRDRPRTELEDSRLVDPGLTRPSVELWG